MSKGRSVIKRIATLALVLALVVSGGCGSKKSEKPTGEEVLKKNGKLKESTLNYRPSLDEKLSYQNENTARAADPCVIYVTEGEYAGYFFAYATSGASGFNALKSKDLTHWTSARENEAPVFQSDMVKNWGKKNFWAPEVIFDGGKYYMFYSASASISNGYMFYISCAVSDSPAGPFTEITGAGKAANAPLLSFEDHVSEIPAEYRSQLTGRTQGKAGFIKVIDASPFIDPQTGKKYLYFVSDIGTDYTPSSFIFGMEMQDWSTPLYGTLKKLTEYGFTTTDKKKTIHEGNNTNEGPYMLFDNGTYYLTFSTFAYTTTQYQVRQALGTSPLGPFEKVAVEEGGAVLWSEEKMLPKGTGHHVFLRIGDELWMSYHALINGKNNDDGRAVAMDRVTFVTNKSGKRVLAASGPTRTRQPLPALLTGYSNVASRAAVSIEGASGDTKLLTDGYAPFHPNAPTPEFTSDGGKFTLTFTFESPVALSQILLYNSTKDAALFESVKEVVIRTDKEKLTAADIAYPTAERAAKGVEIAGKTLYDLPLVMAFDETAGVKSVTITFDCEHAIGIPEIMMMGKVAEGK